MMVWVWSLFRILSRNYLEILLPLLCEAWFLKVNKCTRVEQNYPPRWTSINLQLLNCCGELNFNFLITKKHLVINCWKDSWSLLQVYRLQWNASEPLDGVCRFFYLVVSKLLSKSILGICFLAQGFQYLSWSIKSFEFFHFHFKTDCM